MFPNQLNGPSSVFGQSSRPPNIDDNQPVQVLHEDLFMGYIKWDGALMVAAVEYWTRCSWSRAKACDHDLTMLWLGRA